MLPTDTVYGIGADAFTPHAVTALLRRQGARPQHAAAGAGRLPAHPRRPGLLAAAGGPRPGRRVLAGRADDHRRALAEPAVGPRRDRRHGRRADAAAPGRRSRCCARSARWRCSTANKTGQPAPTTAEEAREQLDYAVRVYLEAGPCADPVPSTIVDVTGDVPRMLRDGAIPLEKLRDVVPGPRRPGMLSAAVHRPARVHGQHLPVADGRAAARARRPAAAGACAGGTARSTSARWCTATAPAPAAGTTARR